MNSFQNLPDAEINAGGKVANLFLELGISSFKEACAYVHNLPYGYNSNYDDPWILFKEKKGTCTTKHAVIAALAKELGIPLYKYIGIYKFTEEIVEGAGNINKKYEIPYIPMIHCFLRYQDFQFDLTEGNYNGKKTTIDNFIHTEKVEPFIRRKTEYLLFKNVIREKILPSKDMEGIKERTLLKAREEAILLLKKNVKTQRQDQSPF